MVKVPVHTRMIPSADPSASESNPSTEPGSSQYETTGAGHAVPAPDPFDFDAFGLVREFVEKVVVPGAAASLGEEHAHAHVIDWDVVRASVANSSSFEQAIGRAVVVADQMSRGIFAYDPEGVPFASPDDAEPFFAFSVGNAIPDFGDESRYRTKVARRMGGILKRRKSVAVMALSVLLALFSLGIYQITQHNPAALASTQGAGFARGNAQILKTAAITAATVSLPVSTTPPAAAPPSLATAAPLRPHEVFGFAPYWTLSQSAGFDVSKLSTIAYFSIDVNPDGSLNESGPGWNGYQSQALSDLITRAHTAGDKVVLTVTCFDQRALNKLTASLTSPSTLSTALISALQAKSLDGVNLDFEGSGSADQEGLTRLVTQVSLAIHDANSHYQVTMDTYASSAGDASGFYNIRALAPAVDGFFVMEYQPNLQSGGSAQSPLTSSMFSDRTTIDQYLAAVPASKVVLGLPYFGIDWPTTDGTLTAQATGGATQPSYGQIASSGHPVYWDPTTSTAWTSYQVGTQWHETFFEDPTSLYDVAQLATANNLAGVGIWALGMDGNNAAMLSALAGFSPAVKDGAVVGPQSTSPSDPADPTTIVSSTTTSIGTPATTSATSTSSSTTTSTPSTTTSTGSPSTTSTTAISQPNSEYEYTGTWNGQTVDLTPWTQGTTPDTGASTGQLGGYTTNDPSASCLTGGPELDVEPLVGSSSTYLVMATEPVDCTNALYTFTVASS